MLQMTAQAENFSKTFLFFYFSLMESQFYAKMLSTSFDDR